LKLLLDEMYPHAIAEQLRRLGHDVDAITQRAELRTLPDLDVFAAAQQERRALLSENIADFSKIADEHDRAGRAHHGLVLVDPAKYPRGLSGTIGRMVTELDRLLQGHSGDDAVSLRHWL
jgi:hypothetical protein